MGTMQRVRASVVCYHCGHRSGVVEAPIDGSLATGIYRPSSRPDASIPTAGRRVRCARCGGPTYFDELQPIAEPPPRLVAWIGRGRPPKNAVRIPIPLKEGERRRRPRVLYAVAVDGQPVDPAAFSGELSLADIIDPTSGADSSLDAILSARSELMGRVG